MKKNTKAKTIGTVERERERERATFNKLNRNNNINKKWIGYLTETLNFKIRLLSNNLSFLRKLNILQE